MRSKQWSSRANKIFIFTGDDHLHVVSPNILHHSQLLKDKMLYKKEGTFNKPLFLQNVRHNDLLVILEYADWRETDNSMYLNNIKNKMTVTKDLRKTFDILKMNGFDLLFSALKDR